jgi:hypothetical protein
VRSRYAEAMLLHAFAAQAGAGEFLAAAAGGEPAGVALLAAVSTCLGLGAATTEQITLSENGKVALQILTSDFDAGPAEILAWLKSR